MKKEIVQCIQTYMYTHGTQVTREIEDDDHYNILLLSKRKCTT